MKKAGKYLRCLISSVLFLGFLGVFSGLALRCASLAGLEIAPGILALRAGHLVSFSLLVLLIFAVLTLLWGRVYCSFCCPLGYFQDIFSRLGRFFHPYRTQKNHVRFRLFWGGACVGLLLTGATVWLGCVEPFSLFGRGAAQFFRKPLQLLLSKCEILFIEQEPAASSALLFFTAGTLFLLALSAFWKGRLFCNTLCPVGLLLSALARKAHDPLTLHTRQCVRCGKCVKECKAGCIDLKAGKIDFSRCVGCLNCLAACPRGAISFAVTRSSAPADPGRRRFLLYAGAGAAAGAGAVLLGRHLAPTPAEVPLMPPGAGSLREFTSRCTGCQLCVANCSGHVLVPSLFEYGITGIGQVRLSPVKGFCDFSCNNCSTICPTGALQSLPLRIKQRRKIGQAAYHRSRCVVVTAGEDCGACAEHCPTGALQMVPFGDEGLTIPKLTPQICIGCGACQYICPVTPEKAMTVTGLARQVQAEDPAAVLRGGLRNASAHGNTVV